MSDKMRELLPCPFCGGPVDIEKTIDGRKWYGVVCRNTFNRGGSCAVSIRPSASEECAIERWNMRAQSVSVPVAGDVVACLMCGGSGDSRELRCCGNRSDDSACCGYPEPEMCQQCEGTGVVYRQPPPSISAAELDALRKDAASLAEARELLMIWQSWLGASRNQCDDAGKKLWDRIEAIAGEKK